MYSLMVLVAVVLLNSTCCSATATENVASVLLKEFGLTPTRAKLQRYRSGTWSPPSSAGELDVDYEDFPEVPSPLAQMALGLQRPMAKRYLGIDIPGWVSGSNSKSNAIKVMSDKMRAMGRRKK